MYLSPITHFRAIAILTIVAGHSRYPAGMGSDLWVDALLTNVILGGTTFFVFISGYLFHHVFASRWDYRAFIVGKARNVLLPYLIIAVPCSAAALLWDGSFRADVLGDGPALLQGVKLVLTGALFQAYWFIPFIMVTYLLAPLHMRFLRLGARVQVSLIAVLLLVALFLHRPVDNLNVLQSVIYFTPVYLLGMVMSLYRKEVTCRIRGRELYLLGAALVVLVVQTCFAEPGNPQKHWNEYGGIDLMLLQKLLLTVAILALLERVSGWRSRGLEYLAETSFAIFFLHPIGLILIQRAQLGTPFGTPWVDLWATAAMAVAFSVAIAAMGKRALGRKSRLVMGY